MTVKYKKAGPHFTRYSADTSSILEASRSGRRYAHNLSKLDYTVHLSHHHSTDGSESDREQLRLQ
jgi:hypothetical protein